LLDLDVILSDYPTTTSAPEARRKAAEAHLGLGDELAAAGKAEPALEQYDLILKQFADTPSADAARANSGTVRMQVAALYHQQGKFSDAVTLYQLILAEYSAIPETARASEELPQVYLDWGLSLFEAKRYEEALARLNQVTAEFPTSTAATRVASSTVDIYVAWGQSLIDQKQYTQAIDKLHAAMESISDPKVREAVEVAYQDAVHALAKDTGTQGQAVIQETIARACDYKVALSPAVGILSGKVYGVVCKGNLSLDSRYYPQNPGNFYYAFFLTEGYNNIESCEYTGGRTLIRQQIYWTVAVRNVASMGVAGQKSFTGSMPPECPNFRYFYSYTEYSTGGYPNSSEIYSWMASFLNP
jgi:tetratricopeptide (TPR) repeat protein